MTWYTISGRATDETYGQGMFIVEIEIPDDVSLGEIAERFPAIYQNNTGDTVVGEITIEECKQ